MHNSRDIFLTECLSISVSILYIALLQYVIEKVYEVSLFNTIVFHVVYDAIE